MNQIFGRSFQTRFEIWYVYTFSLFDEVMHLWLLRLLFSFKSFEIPRLIYFLLIFKTCAVDFALDSSPRFTTHLGRPATVVSDERDGFTHPRLSFYTVVAVWYIVRARVGRWLRWPRCIVALTRTSVTRFKELSGKFKRYFIVYIDFSEQLQSRHQNRNLQ